MKLTSEVNVCTSMTFDIERLEYLVVLNYLTTAV